MLPSSPPSPSQSFTPELKSKIAFTSWDMFILHMKVTGRRRVCASHAEIALFQSTFPSVTICTLQKYGFNFALEIWVKLCYQHIFFPVLTFHSLCRPWTVYGLHLLPSLIEMVSSCSLNSFCIRGGNIRFCAQ